MVQVDSLEDDLILVDSTIVVGSVGISRIHVGIRSVGIMIVSPSIVEWVVGEGIGGIGDNFIVGKSVMESSVGIRISLTIEVSVLCLSI